LVILRYQSALFMYFNFFFKCYIDKYIVTTKDGDLSITKMNLQLYIMFILTNIMS